MSVMELMPAVDRRNYLAIRLLEKVGNYQPNQAQIDLVAAILASPSLAVAYDLIEAEGYPSLGQFCSFSRPGAGDFVRKTVNRT